MVVKSCWKEKKCSISYKCNQTCNDLDTCNNVAITIEYMHIGLSLIYYVHLSNNSKWYKMTTICDTVLGYLWHFKTHGMTFHFWSTRVTWLNHFGMKSLAFTECTDHKIGFHFK